MNWCGPHDFSGGASFGHPTTSMLHCYSAGSGVHRGWRINSHPGREPVGRPARRFALLAAIAAHGVLSAFAFANAPIGTVIENPEMPTLEGGKHQLLGDTNVSIFVFIKPGLEHSHTALVQIAECQKEMAGKAVHWSAVVSDRIPRAQVEQEVKDSGLAMPVLIDQGDVLYGKLGVILHPSIGITDRDHRLLAYEPFKKVNYAAVIRAGIRHALKEISDEELDKILKPPPPSLTGDASVALRYFKLAEKQFQATNYVQALANINKSIEKDPGKATAHTLYGRILA